MDFVVFKASHHTTEGRKSKQARQTKKKKLP
jgi:hypothetical protein